MNYSDWVRKNWVTVFGIIIILSVVLIDLRTVQQQKINAIDSCNEHWERQVKVVCPELYEPVPYSYTDSGLFIPNSSAVKVTP